MYHFLITHKKTLFGILFLILFSATVSSATPPTPQTLDPDCLPTDPACIITVNTWNKTNTTLSYTDGLVGIGTTTPDSTLHVAGEIRGNNLVITGDSATVAQTTQAQATFNYGSSGYTAQGYSHNYRIYAYKNTSAGRVYSATYTTLTVPSLGTPPDAPTNISATQTCDSGCSYYADAYSHNYRVYSYKIVGDHRVYSSTYADLPVNFTDDISAANYDITVSWDAVSDADGYRVLKYDNNSGYNYNAGYDTASTSFIDDACNSVCFNSNTANIDSVNSTDNGSFDQYTISLSWNTVSGADGYRVLKYSTATGYNYNAGYDTIATSLVDNACGTVCFNTNASAVTPTQRYTNAATINGQLTLSGPLLINSQTFSANSTRNYVLGESAGVGSNNTFFVGYAAGAGTTTVVNANFLGQGAGQSATNTSNANFFGNNAGAGATNANGSNFFGLEAGLNATNANGSNFFGQSAGLGATGASNSNFFGLSAGTNATNAAYSNFFGINTGVNAYNASNSIFIGQNAGVADTVDNNTNGLSSILIGSFTNTGGYSNSILLGSGINGSPIANTQANQFMLAPSITNARFRDIDYVFPSAQASATGQALVNDGSGGLSWTTVGVSLDSNKSFILGGGSSAEYSNFIGHYAGRNALNIYFSNFFGLSAGQNATNASNSNFFGASAGDSATFASNSNFFGNSVGAVTTNASYSNLFGFQVAYNIDGVGYGIGSNNIIIGTNISLPDATANAMNLGGVLFGTGFYSNIYTYPSKTPVSGGRIGIGKVTPSYTLDVGNSSVSGIVAGFQNSSGTCTINPTTTSLSCSSDYNLKKNITTLSDYSPFALSPISLPPQPTVLTKLSLLTPVQYNWNTESDTDPKHTGFIAQQVESLFPDLVSTDSNTGLKSLAYTGLIPYTVKAIQEMNFTITALPDTTKANSLRDSLIAWFGDVNNGIQQLFVKQVNTKKLCVDDVCIERDQFKKVIEVANQQSSTSVQTVDTPASTDTPVVNTEIPPEDTTTAPELPLEQN